MLDSQKIDSFFDGKTTYHSRPERGRSGISWRRLIKLTLPCLAALLFGLLVIIPNIKKSVDLSDSVTLPRKNEMEQLHMEKTIFNVTDNKNRVNRIEADSVDETNAGSQVYKIINPKGAIPTDTGKTDVSSEIGYFNQKSNVLKLRKNVKAVVNQNTVITTEKASYDFDNDKGWGNLAVYAEGDWGTMNAEAFTYDKTDNLLILKGKHNINTERGSLDATKETQIYRNENKTISLGNAVITQNERKLYADKIVAYFSKSSKKELERLEAYGNVKVVTPKETITGGEGYYSVSNGKIEIYADSKSMEQQKGFVNIKQGEHTLRARQVSLFLSKDGNNIERVQAIGDLKIVSPQEIITAGEGTYIPQSGRIELFGTSESTLIQKGMVEIIQAENVLHARHVRAYIDKSAKIKRAEAFVDVEVITPKGSAWGDRGIYNATENKVELFDNVRLEQNGNYIVGAHAVTDLTSSVSRITGNETTGGRISGTFYKKRKENNEPKK